MISTTTVEPNQLSLVIDECISDPSLEEMESDQVTSICQNFDESFIMQVLANNSLVKLHDTVQKRQLITLDMVLSNEEDLLEILREVFGFSNIVSTLLSRELIKEAKQIKKQF